MLYLAPIIRACYPPPKSVESAPSKFARLLRAADPPCYTILVGSINP